MIDVVDREEGSGRNWEEQIRAHWRRKEVANGVMGTVILRLLASNDLNKEDDLQCMALAVRSAEHILRTKMPGVSDEQKPYAVRNLLQVEALALLVDPEWQAEAW